MGVTAKGEVDRLSGQDDRLNTVVGSYRFDIDGVGSVRVEVEHGRLSAREDSGPADCVIACGADDYERIVNGEQNLLTAYMRGRVRIEGSLALAKSLHGILPGPRLAGSEEARR